VFHQRPSWVLWGGAGKAGGFGIKMVGKAKHLGSSGLNLWLPDGHSIQGQPGSEPVADLLLQGSHT
jgi:hypothetical protein